MPDIKGRQGQDAAQADLQPLFKGLKVKYRAMCRVLPSERARYCFTVWISQAPHRLPRQQPQLPSGLPQCICSLMVTLPFVLASAVAWVGLLSAAGLLPEREG